MKTLTKVFVALMVGFGFLVGFLSIYHASFVGLFSQMGVGEIKEESIDEEELRELVVEKGMEVDCGVFGYFENYVGYRRGIREEKARMGFGIGEQRVYCGMREVLRGRRGWGSYMIVKGLRYLKKSSDIFEKGEISLEEGMCRRENEEVWRRAENTEELLEGFLDATEGSLHEAILQMYEPLRKDWSEVGCLDRDS